MNSSKLMGKCAIMERKSTLSQNFGWKNDTILINLFSKQNWLTSKERHISLFHFQKTDVLNKKEVKK